MTPSPVAHRPARRAPAPILAWLMLLAAFFLSAPAPRGETPSLDAAVLFNTECARCHEGECSGRMTFHLAPEASTAHMERHGGPLSARKLGELFALLRYTKESCAFYPLPWSLVRDGPWDGAMLERLRSPLGPVYFIPLGDLEAGPKRVRLAGQGLEERACIEIIDAEFGYLTDLALEAQTDPSGWLLHFRSLEPGAHFLRIKGADGLMLNAVGFVAIP